MNFTLTERLQLVLALTLALTATLPGLAVALLVLGRLAVARLRRHEPARLPGGGVRRQLA
jgi:hypothetical protein